ncbi:hypothetical protein CNT09_09795 [Campylobacter coli]|uniref:Uncharacterized protein n=1 Tax=Helicobacter pullorum TaxID=35818 RepID=A0A0N0LRZ9_9HELI|nr:hypothetical protein [Campylobacter coli]EAK6386390.1 hypothetical protein [Campylobacter coli]KPH53655.1 hypothetical protein HPU229334_00965 [Helicobacter pullorum]
MSRLTSFSLLIIEFSVVFLIPSFVFNIIILLIPQIRRTINIYFLYGGLIGIAFGGILGLSLTLNNLYGISFIVLYVVGFISSLYIMIPHALMYLFYKIRNITNNNQKAYLFGAILYSIEILFTLLYIFKRIIQ